MNAAAFFARAAELPVGTLADITGGGGLVVVAPHPDDESLGCGALIAAACAAKVPVRLVVVSDGVGSHPNSTRFPPSRLRALREAETLAAAAELGLDADSIRFLRLPDRAVPTTGAAAQAASAMIAATVHEIDACAICVTWLHDPHCDHQASAALVEAARAKIPATRVFFYPVWGWTLAADTEVGSPPAGFRFDASRYIAAKLAAIAAHRSQTTRLIDDDPAGFRLQPDMIARCTGRYEIFIASASVVPS